MEFERRARRPEWLELLQLVVITARERDAGRGHLDVAIAALAGGCRAIQFRDKEMSDRGFVEVARAVQLRCIEAGALFFVNDRVHVAAGLDCEVHLGVDDMPVALARKVLGPAAIIGFSPESAAQAREAADAGADYLGVGPVFGSPSKSDAGPAIGLDGLEGYCASGIAPVVAVGGIDAENAPQVAAAGAEGIAVVSAVSRAADMAGAARALIASFGAARRESERRKH